MGIRSTYALTLLLILMSIFILSFTTLTKRKYLFVFCITLSLSILAFFYNPIVAFSKGNYTDLYRFYQTLNSIRGLPFNNNSSIFQEYNNILVMKVLLFLISRTGINGLLPFISSFIFYGISGIFIIKICEQHNVSHKIMGLSLFTFICLFNFTMVISNIRCPIGDAIFMLTLYYDFFKKQKSKLYWLGYLICCCIHPVFILFTLLRILLLLVNKLTNTFFYIVILAYSLFINSFSEMIGTLTNIKFFSYLSMKMDFYMQNSSHESLILLTGILQIIVLSYFLIILKNKISKKTSIEKFYHLTLIFIIFTVGSIWNPTVFQRCTWLLLFFVIYWFVYLKSLKKQKQNFTIQIYEIVMVALVVFSLLSYFFTYQYNVLTF